VQLSGFVSHRGDIESAIRLARNVDGVTAVTNDMQLK
jgi:osmotically-inducible protein OsmY